MEDFQQGQERPDMALNTVLGMLQDMRHHPCHLQLLKQVHPTLLKQAT